jgi:hypothetical protein
VHDQDPQGADRSVFPTRLLQQAAMLALSRVLTTTLCAWTVLILMVSYAATEQGPMGGDSLIGYWHKYMVDESI